jgi:cytochrome b6-f complex iron-sulfur subunit
MEITEPTVSRRLFLRIIGWGSLFITIGISIVGSIRFLFPRVLFEKPLTFKIGFPDRFREEGSGQRTLKVFEEWKEEHGVWIVKENNRLYAIHSRCTHLGCTPNWFAEDGVFKCPCHGSQFYGNGVNFAGPAPRPLDRFKISLDVDGQIIIDKGKIYTYKEFDKPGAYLKI